MLALERRALRGDLSAEQELRRWATHEAALFGLRAPARIELERVLKDRPNLLIAARLETMPPSVVAAIGRLDEVGLRAAAEALVAWDTDGLTRLLGQGSPPVVLDTGIEGEEDKDDAK
jgi:hypothetical protein